MRGRLQQARSDLVHDNVLTATGAGEIAGLDQDEHDPSAFTSRNIRFVDYTYQLPDLVGPYFSWNDAILTSAAWTAAGQDTTGTFVSP